MRGIGFTVGIDGNQNAFAFGFALPDALFIGQNQLLKTAIAQCLGLLDVPLPAW